MVDSSLRTPLVRLAVVAAILTAAWVGLLAYGAAQLGPVTKGAFVEDYDGRVLDDGLEILLVQSDGQAFATLARDPTLRNPERFGTIEEASYRAQRPLMPFLAAIGSIGWSGWVPPALATIAIAGTVLAVAGCGALLAHRGASPWWALVVLILPGTAGTLAYLGPEPLMLALLAWGLVFWERRRLTPAVVLLSLAVLTRETAIIVPTVLGGTALLRRDQRAVRSLVVVPVVMAAWYVVLRARVGAWPWEAGEGRIGPPFIGIHVARRDLWDDAPTQTIHVLLLLIVVLVTIIMARRDPLASVVIAHAVFATLLGEYVWAEVDFYSRVLLPLYALGIVAIVGSRTKREGLTLIRDDIRLTDRRKGRQPEVSSSVGRE